MKKSWILLAVLAAVAVAQAFVLVGCGPSTDGADTTPPPKKRARIVPGDLSDEQLEQVGEGEPGAQAPDVPPLAGDAAVAPGAADPPGNPASSLEDNPADPSRVMPDPGLLARFELIMGDMPEGETPTDVVWSCPEAHHTCNVEGTLATTENIASFMHGLEDNPQAEDDEIPTVQLIHMNSLPDGGKRFQLQLELP